MSTKKGKLDFFKHISLQMSSLKLLGLYPFIQHPKMSVKYWMTVVSKIFIFLFAFIIPTGGQLVYLIKLILSDNAEISEIAGILNLVLTEIVTLVGLVDLTCRRKALNRLINEFSKSEFHHYTEPQKIILEKAIKQSRFMHKIVSFMAYTDVVGHIILMPAKLQFKELPLRMDLLIIDVNDPKYFVFIFIFQVAYKPWMVTTFLLLKTLPWSTMIFTISQLDVLIHNFDNMKEVVKTTRIESQCDENEAFKIIFRRCVLHHSAIIRFVNAIQSSFSGSISVTLLTSACINGTTTLQFLLIKSPLANLTEVFWVSAYLSIFIGMLYVDTYLGTKLTTKAAFLPTAIYSSCPWIKLNNNMKKNLMIFMSKSQRPLVIKAVKMIPVSLETFTVVMNWTYKGFAILNQMK